MSNHNTDIQPTRLSIGELFDGNRAFAVPDYQRPYSWGKPQIQDLIDDYQDSREQFGASSATPLFLGTFILATGSDVYQIVDGQQRLTTISLMLIALRECVKQLELKHGQEATKVASHLGNKVSKSSPLRNDRDKPIIKVAPEIREVYEQMTRYNWNGQLAKSSISKRDVKVQWRKLFDAYSMIYNQFAVLSLDGCKQLALAIEESYAVVLMVSRTIDVLSIFERTNTRGLDLNVGDLLKSHIFSYNSEKYEGLWSEICMIAGDKLPKTLKAFHRARHGKSKDKQANKELYEAIKHDIDKRIELDNLMGWDMTTELLHEMRCFAEFYEAANDPNVESIERWLNNNGLESVAKNENDLQMLVSTFQSLKYFGITQTTPLLFSMITCYRKTNDIHRKSAKTMLFRGLEALEKYHFINNKIASQRGNIVDDFYAELGVKFYEQSEHICSLITCLIAGLRERLVSASEFTERFLHSATYDDPKLILYVYDRINNFKTKGTQRYRLFHYDSRNKLKNHSIEHILAQDYKQDIEVEDDRDKIDSIGNLLVVCRFTNSSLQNKLPSEKVKHIRSDKKYTTNLRYLDEFVDEYEHLLQSWNCDLIQERATKIASRCYLETFKF